MSAFRQCARCVLDSLCVRDIQFDSSGVCNYCRYHDQIADRPVFKDTALREKALENILGKIKHSGKAKKYDCLIGLSGGVDSSYLAWVAKERGLRPLAVHFDNCWNSEIAVSNISSIVKNLNLDLFTYVIPWDEFKDLQLAYMKASVVDIEVPTDHLIFATLYKIAAKKNIKYILSGYNYATESIMPKGWNYSKFDLKNLENIHKGYGEKKLLNFPKLGCYQRFFYNKILGIQMIDFLNFVPYVKADAKSIIARELGWRDYGYKHFESIFTRFYQGFILPRKFNIDKRKAHFSNLICSNQMSKEEALQELEKPPYPKDQQEIDKEYVIKKLELSENEFESIMKLPVRDHAEFGNDSNLPQRILKRLRAA